MVNKLEALLLGGLFLAPCAVILSHCALAPSLFALHPAANALAFLVCFPAYAARTAVDSDRRGCLTLLDSLVQRHLCHGRAQGLLGPRVPVSHPLFRGTQVASASNQLDMCDNRVTLTKAHFALQSLALVLMSVGGVAAFLTKEAYGKSHLTSRHSWVAAAAATLSLLNALGVGLSPLSEASPNRPVFDLLAPFGRGNRAWRRPSLAARRPTGSGRTRATASAAPLPSSSAVRPELYTVMLCPREASDSHSCL